MFVAYTKNDANIPEHAFQRLGMERNKICILSYFFSISCTFTGKCFSKGML